ncbi:Hypothetical predicted protein [Podarcis lilfordi]|uniref:Secreted protein n=1 Tax=Podarcis lilfordi TaxID=74358 RepID=A0AA35KQI5_9SAUR|nr:Hypothetical predicted protein [Podarcis lilfordi]
MTMTQPLQMCLWLLGVGARPREVPLWISFSSKSFKKSPDLCPSNKRERGKKKRTSKLLFSHLETCLC